MCGVRVPGDRFLCIAALALKILATLAASRCIQACQKLTTALLQSRLQNPALRCFA
jgi:hypothetical protein